MLLTNKPSFCYVVLVGDLKSVLLLIDYFSFKPFLILSHRLLQKRLKISLHPFLHLESCSSVFEIVLMLQRTGQQFQNEIKVRLDRWVLLNDRKLRTSRIKRKTLRKSCSKIIREHSDPNSYIVTQPS